MTFPKTYHYGHNPTSFSPLNYGLVILQINRLVRKNLKSMIALFIVSIAVFIYMIYVLIKPEKF
ncbi:MAG: potassium-transporting ATPase subunit F [Sphingobacteriaceae bacterium]|nr:potassium-transporting ATPase subunit F [Sphingobacteriaceae bacterium]